jgi:transposase
MKRIGEEVAEKLEFVPGVFTVDRHIRGKWVGVKCEMIHLVSVDPHVIDKGIPTTVLLARVPRYADDLPLYRQAAILGLAGPAIPRSSLTQWVGSCGVQLQTLVDAMRIELLQHRVLHADRTPVAMLKPGNGKTHRACPCAYATGAFGNTNAGICQPHRTAASPNCSGTHGVERRWHPEPLARTADRGHKSHRSPS